MKLRHVAILGALLLIVAFCFFHPSEPAPSGQAVRAPVKSTPHLPPKQDTEFNHLYDQLLSAAPRDEKPLPFKSKGRVRLKPGESAVLGFWQLSRDRNGLAIITPTPMPDGNLKLETRLMQVSDAVAGDKAVRDLFPAPFDIEQYGAMDADIIRNVLEHLNGTQGVNMLSMPVVVTRPGQRASIMVGQVERDGSTLKQGLNLDLDASVPAADGSLELDLGLDLRE